MNDFLVLGTDTDAGKTTFALLWLAHFGDEFAYWKPLETGDSDSATIRRLLPDVRVHPSILRFVESVAPLLAARLHRQSIPSASKLSHRKPEDSRPLLIESFGGPFSPLNDEELQIALIDAFALPVVLVSSSALGAIGRTLQCLVALESRGIVPRAVVLVGKRDEFAEDQIRRQRPSLPVFSLKPPGAWTREGVAMAAADQAEALRSLRVGMERETHAVGDDDLLARDRDCVWHPYTSLRESEPPLVCVGAQDEFLHLADGRGVIDGISSWWTILHGHRYPPLMQALVEAVKKYDHVHFAGVTHPAAVEFADLLLSTVSWFEGVAGAESLKPRPVSSPTPLPGLRKASAPATPANGGRVFYSDNGSTAVEVALKMAYQFWCHLGEPARMRFVGFEHGYHGDTFGAMAVGRDPVFFGRFEPLLFPADILPLSPERLDEHLQKLGKQTAAVILEPLVQGAGGMRMHTPDALRTLFNIAKRHGVLFIADEVMTGGGRLGTLWAHQQAGIHPDLICAGKTLAGGVLPLAATLAAPHIVAAWDTDDRRCTFFHGHSFTANPLACAGAVANWRLLTAQFPEAPRRMEAFWKESLAPLAHASGVKEVRVLGSIVAVEMMKDGGYLAEVGPCMRRSCLEKGVLLRPLGNVLYAMPPFCTSQDSLDQIADAMIAAVRQVRLEFSQLA